MYITYTIILVILVCICDLAFIQYPAYNWVLASYLTLPLGQTPTQRWGRINSAQCASLKSSLTEGYVM